VNTARCQTQCWPAMSEGVVDNEPQSLQKRAKMMLKRRLSHRTKRRLKVYANRLINWFAKLGGKSKASPVTATDSKASRLRAGDLVRVRPREEIEATLDAFNELRGCMFMEAMWPYCGTTQRVLKTVERFVDERDYRVKRARGLILLEGLICEGTPDYGRCDRACFYFWREEWLEKIDEP